MFLKWVIMMTLLLSATSSLRKVEVNPRKGFSDSTTSRRTFSPHDFVGHYVLFLGISNGRHCPTTIDHTTNGILRGDDSVEIPHVTIFQDSTQCGVTGSVLLRYGQKLSSNQISTVFNITMGTQENEHLLDRILAKVNGFYLGTETLGRNCGATSLSAKAPVLFTSDSAAFGQVIRVPFSGFPKVMLLHDDEKTCAYSGHWSSPSPSPSPSVTPTPSATPSTSLSPSASPSQSPSPSGTPSATLTATPSKSSAPTPSKTSTPTPSKSLAPTPSKTSTPTPSKSPAPTPSKTSTPTPSKSPAPTPSKTSTPNPSMSSTPSPSKTRAPNKPQSSTPSPSASATPSPSITWTPSVSASSSPTISPTSTPSIKPTPSPSASNSPALSSSSTPSPSPSPTATVSSTTGSRNVTLIATESQTTNVSLSPSVSQTPNATLSPSYSPLVNPTGNESTNTSVILFPNTTLETTNAPQMTVLQINSSSPPMTAVMNSPSLSASPSVVATPTPDSSSTCFPASAMARLSNGQQIRVDELQVGDRVMVGEGKYSEVIDFSHSDHSIRTLFLRFTVENGRKLTVSNTHYLYSSQGLVVGKRITTSDSLQLEDGSMSRVRLIEVVEARGLFNPHTMHGDIAIDGFRTSTYTAVLKPKVAHALLSPVRALHSLGRKWSIVSFMSSHSWLVRMVSRISAGEYSR